MADTYVVVHLLPHTERRGAGTMCCCGGLEVHQLAGEVSLLIQSHAKSQRLRPLALDSSGS